MMGRRGSVHLPVIDEESRPSGVFNARDALPVLSAEQQCEEAQLRDCVMGIGFQ